MMSAGDDHAKESLIDELLVAIPLQDLPPAAAERIETICLTRLRRRRKQWPPHRGSSFLEALEAVLASLLGSGYLLWELGRGLVLYGVHLR